MSYKVALTVGICLFVCISGYDVSQNKINRVAFSAGLTQSRKVADNEVVLYDRVYTNIGKSYNQFTGTFTSPLDGTYVFYISLLCQEKSRAWLKLYQNLQQKISLYERDLSYYGGSGTSVILNLRQNDQVYLRSAGDSYLYGDPADVYTVFSGHLLYSDEKRY